MVPNPFRRLEDKYSSPLTSPSWRSDQVTDFNRRSTAAADPAGSHLRSPHLPDLPQAMGGSGTSNSSRGHRELSVFYMPQSFQLAPPPATQKPTTQRASATAHTTLSLRSTRQVSAAPIADDIRSSQPEWPLTQQFTLLEGSSSATSTEQNRPTAPNLEARRNTTSTTTSPDTQSIPLDNITPSLSRFSEDEAETESVFPRLVKPHMGCYSRQDVYIKRWSWLYVTLVILSLYSTVLSGIWFSASIFQPRYGRGVSTGEGWRLAPGTATLLAALFAKTIELSFVTVFVAVLGQVITRRAFSRLSRRVTLAEMTMRNWVIQPGSLLTHWEGFPKAATTFLGALTLAAAICSLFYTTASDAMVSPKLSTPSWTTRNLKSLVRASYANPYYIKDTCQIPIVEGLPSTVQESCVNVLYSGQSYHSLVAFMQEWDAIRKAGNSTLHKLSDRPTAKHNLFDNTTMESSWIETEYGDMAANFAKHKRVINNVTLAMPHPGVYAAATDPVNGILQPNELMGVGEYSVRASVVSPAVNVMCVNMNASELAPIVYTRFPNARIDHTSVPGQVIGVADWQKDIPQPLPTEYLNRTVVDDIFKWGEKYGRRPPIFQLYPLGYNIITNWTDYSPDTSLYALARFPNITDYTLCELRSWLTPKCSTSFNLSGTSGGYMKAHCEDANDKNAYERVNKIDADKPPQLSGDWRNVAVQWGLAIDLSGGTQNNNASNAWVLTNLIRAKPALETNLPSVAEALAVLVANTAVVGAQDSPFQASWQYNAKDNILDPPGVYETFHAQVRTQQYTSTHTAAWQAIFYPVLGFTFVLNVLCLMYIVSGTSLTSSTFFSSTKRNSSLSSPSSSLPLFTGPEDKRDSSLLAFPFRMHSRHTAVKPAPSDGDLLDEEDPDLVLRNKDEERGRKAAKGLVTDYTEPQNLFALAINSPHSRALAGSCGHGPNAAELGVPWRIGYTAGANHYFFEEGNNAGAAYGNATAMNSGAALLAEEGQYGASYKRLSSRRPWL